MYLVNRLLRVGQVAHHYLLPLVVTAYVFAAFWPAAGLWAKHHEVFTSAGVTLTLPMLLLGVLLFNASLGSSAWELVSVVRRPLTVLAGVTANLLIPMAFVLVLRLVLLPWHNDDEVNSLLLGLALVAAMPVAGSSTAWSQNVNGNVALSLGLVLFSTLLSPLTTPLLLAGLGGVMDNGLPSALAGGQTGWFLTTVVVVPSAAGLALHGLVGSEIVSGLKPALKLVNTLVLVFLCYANATVALPQVIASPDWDFLALIIAAVAGLCVTAFASGWCLGKALGANDGDRRSLMFGLGMSNNGTGMVLAASALVTVPFAMIPVLAYNLMQHVVAGMVSRNMTIPGEDE